MKKKLFLAKEKKKRKKPLANNKLNDQKIKANKEKKR